MSRDPRTPESNGASLPLLIIAWGAASVAYVSAAINTFVLPAPAQNGGAYFIGIFILLTVDLGTMGALVASRRPRHPIGWLLLLAGVLFSISVVGSGYAAESERLSNGTWPLTVLAAWLSSWTFVPALGVVAIFVPLLFPTGHLPTPRWRPMVPIGAAGLLGGLAPAAFSPGPLSEVTSVTNPVGIPGAGPILELINTLSGILAPAVFVAVIVSLVLRYRHGSQTERDQIKWFLYPAGIAAIGLGIGLPDAGLVSDAGWTIGLTGMALLPVAIGIAILRHRLFDIDLLIKRTLVYGALTLMLGATYVASVLVLQELLAPLVADNGLAIAASTLGVVALFQPLRRRIQGSVDRRFYRSRYDAARVINSFGARLRDQVELDRLTEALHDSVTDALQPASAWVWMRERGARG